MRLAFLCGSLEKGKDGVGDYVRRLAGELTSQGHEVCAIALNDPHLSAEMEERENVSTLRLPAAWPSEKRFERAGKWIAAFDPEWVSVQFVPFGFEKRGLPFGLGKQLRILTRDRRCHIMFHELWVGMKNDSPWKMKVWGWVQRQIIQSVIRAVRPQKVQTQTHLYVAQLAKCGASASYLPLFGNIPIANLCSPEPKTALAFIHFGSIYPEASIATFVTELSQYAKRTNQEASLTLIGRGGAGKAAWQSLWADAGLKIRDLGELPPELISRHLSEASAGITTTPYALVEKSGSVAAMREHGLPVICVSQKWVPRGIEAAPPTSDVSEYEEGKLEGCLQNLKKPLQSAHLAEIARQFIEELETKK